MRLLVKPTADLVQFTCRIFKDIKGAGELGRGASPAEEDSLGSWVPQ